MWKKTRKKQQQQQQQLNYTRKYPPASNSVRPFRGILMVICRPTINPNSPEAVRPLCLPKLKIHGNIFTISITDMPKAGRVSGTAAFVLWFHFLSPARGGHGVKRFSMYLINIRRTILFFVHSRFYTINADRFLIFVKSVTTSRPLINRNNTFYRFGSYRTISINACENVIRLFKNDFQNCKNLNQNGSKQISLIRLTTNDSMIHGK